MRTSIIVPGEPVIIGQGWYRNRGGNTVYVRRNNDGWLDGLPWIVYRCRSNLNTGANEVYAYPSFTVNDEGRLYPAAELDSPLFQCSDDIIRKA